MALSICKFTYRNKNVKNVLIKEFCQTTLYEVITIFINLLTNFDISSGCKVEPTLNVMTVALIIEMQ